MAGLVRLLARRLSLFRVTMRHEACCLCYLSAERATLAQTDIAKYHIRHVEFCDKGVPPRLCHKRKTRVLHVSCTCNDGLASNLMVPICNRDSITHSTASPLGLFLLVPNFTQTSHRKTLFPLQAMLYCQFPLLVMLHYSRTFRTDVIIDPPPFTGSALLDNRSFIAISPLGIKFHVCHPIPRPRLF